MHSTDLLLHEWLPITVIVLILVMVVIGVAYLNSLLDDGEGRSTPQSLTPRKSRPRRRNGRQGGVEVKAKYLILMVVVALVNVAWDLIEKSFNAYWWVILPITLGIGLYDSMLTAKTEG
jgi:hypothetical protein